MATLTSDELDESGVARRNQQEAGRQGRRPSTPAEVAGFLQAERALQHQYRLRVPEVRCPSTSIHGQHLSELSRALQPDACRNCAEERFRSREARGLHARVAESLAVQERLLVHHGHPDAQIQQG